MKKVLLLDLDDTLLDFTRGEKESLEKVLSYYKIENTKDNQELYYLINKKYWRMYELHQIEREKLLGLRFEEFFNHFNIRVDGQRVNELYFSYLSQTSYLIPNALEFCKKCEELSFDIVIVSNGVGSVQKPRIEKSGLKKYFKKVYLSEEIGYNKPDVEFFTSMSLDYSKDQMVIIGDSLSSDILGGINYGITTIWFNPLHKYSDLPDYQVDDLLDIFRILEEN